MVSRNTSADNPMEDKASALGRDVNDRVNQAKESMWDMARTATKKVDESRSTAADRLERAASTVHLRADDLPGGQRVKEFAHAAADRLSTTANYVRNHDSKSMMTDVETTVKNNPGRALLIAAAVGFVLGRALRRN